MKELRLFLLTVGLPAVLLMAVGARLIYAEWQYDAHRREMQGQSAEELRLHDPRPGSGPEGMDLEPPPPPLRGERRKIVRDEFDPGAKRPRPRFGRPGHWVPPPMPPPLLRLFSSRYGMDGSRELTIFGCLVGLMLLSLVSGGWLLMRAARKARLEMLRQTDFVSNVSHEFKTPLTTICLCAELAQDDGLDAARRKKALKAIMDESERLKRLVLNALDFSRLEKNRRKFCLRTVDVAEIVRETCATFAPRLGEGRVRAPEAACTATADADAVRQVLANLMDNVAKYAPTGEVEVTVEPREDRVRISVADRGPGLGAEELRHVFDRFWRGDNSVTRETGGSGLGLAIARGLARGMGGDLTAANREDGGAVFTLELKA